MANAMLDKIPQALKSMYYAEIELRRNRFKGVCCALARRVSIAAT